MRIPVMLASLAMLLPPISGAQTVAATRTGPRPLLPRDYEIALARSAAPASISARARVLAFTDSGFVVADSGTNGVTCVVDRSWPHSLEPHCYDAEGAASVLPQNLRRTQLAHRGKREDEIDREIATGLAAGRFRMPRRPALTYMMSGGQVLYDDDGRRVGAWHPHLMVYYPYLTNSELGLASRPDMQVGMVSDEGTPRASLVIVMSTFVPAPPSR